MSRDTALKLYAVTRKPQIPSTSTDDSEYFIHNFIIAAYSEEEALDIHPSSFYEPRPTYQHEEYMYSKHPERFPDWYDMEWVKNPKEDAYVRELGYVSEDSLEIIKNQDVVALDSTAFL